MNLNSRQMSILDMLKTNKTMTVSQLSEQLFFSASTIRRDLELLDQEKLIRRTHGGATLVVDRNAEIPLSIRANDNRVPKEIIGKAAARFVENGDSLFLDSSTTVLSMLPHVSDKKDLTIITNGLQTASMLSGFRNVKTICTGGTLRENSLSFIGGHARDVLSFYHVDKLFFSVRAISAKSGVSDINEEEALLRKIMLKNAYQNFILMDASKIDKVALCNICGIEEIDAMITNAPFSASDHWKHTDINIIKAC